MEGLSTFLELAGVWAYVALFALAVGESSAFVGLVVPGETFVIAGGVLASKDVLDIRWLIVVVILGGVVGDSIGYALGARWGDAGFARFPRVWSPCRRQRVQSYFRRHGSAAVFWGRFIGLLRPLVPLAAGAARMQYRSFFYFNAAGAVVWGVGTVLIGFLIGSSAHHAVRSFGLGVTGVVVVACLAVLVARGARGRRTAARGVLTEDC